VPRSEAAKHIGKHGTLVATNVPWWSLTGTTDPHQPQSSVILSTDPDPHNQPFLNRHIAVSQAFQVFLC
jgi:hypothetical protein